MFSFDFVVILIMYVHNTCMYVCTTIFSWLCFFIFIHQLCWYHSSSKIYFEPIERKKIIPFRLTCFNCSIRVILVFVVNYSPSRTLVSPYDYAVMQSPLSQFFMHTIIKWMKIYFSPYFVVKISRHLHLLTFHVADIVWSCCMRIGLRQ